MFYYTVRPGDTLYGIASYYGVTVAAILAVNPGLNPYSIYAGQVILIPVHSPLGNAPAHQLFDLVKIEKISPSQPARSFRDYEASINRSEVPTGVTLIEMI